MCDVNYRGKMWSPEKSQATMKELLPLVDICIANDEDAPAGLGMTWRLRAPLPTASRSVTPTSRWPVRSAPSTVARRSPRSSATFPASSAPSGWACSLTPRAAEHWFSPAHDVHVLEGVAAGDAFNAGLVHALINDFDPQDAVNYAIAASILKLTIKGDSNLVTASEIAAVASAADGGTRVAR